jgi:hypothetical protein
MQTGIAVRRWGARLPHAGGALSAIALAVTLLVSFGRGFDWSDEGFYLNWIAFPWDFSASVTMFGFVYHPFYLLADGNIVLLRRLNLLATLLLAVILAVLVGAEDRAPADGRGRWARVWSCLPVAAVVLIFYRFAPPTPSYNSLNLQALLIAAIGIVLLKRSRREAVVGWVLLGLGVSLSFLAKPPSAVAVAVLAFAYLLLVRGARNLPWKGIAVGTSSLIAFLLLAAFLIDGSPAAFVQRLVVGREDLRVMSSGHSLSLGEHFSLTRLGLILSWKRILLWSTVAAGVAVLAWWSLRRPGLLSRLHGWIAAALLAGLLWSFLSLWGFAPPAEAIQRPEAHHPRIEEAVLLALPAGAFAAAIVLLAFSPAGRSGRDRLCLGGLLLALPFAYAYGSGLPVFLESTNAGFFWSLAGLALFPGRDFRVLYVLMTQILVVLAIAAHLDRPYRQSDGIFAPKVPVSIPWRGGTEVGLAPDSANYGLGLAELAEKGGLRPRTPMIDLTGNYPGAQYFLGSKPVGSPWIIGIFPQIETYAGKVLAHVPCEELAEAWVLTGSNEETALPTRLLTAHGINLPEALMELGTLTSPEEEDGFRYTQTLYKPIRPAAQAVAACREARRHDQPRH